MGDPFFRRGELSDTEPSGADLMPFVLTLAAVCVVVAGRLGLMTFFASLAPPFIRCDDRFLSSLTLNEDFASDISLADQPFLLFERVLFEVALNMGATDGSELSQPLCCI